MKKKDKTLRVCVDFRKLNARTVKDSYPIPRISQTLQALSGAEWFCSLDLQSGYFQVKIACKDKAKTAMTTPFGLYEFNRMRFGLTNDPATFQRLVECCLGDLNFQTCLIYLDDVIVFARSFPEMLQRLDEALQCLGEYGLKLKMSKCKLFQRKLTYLGHVVSAAGVEPDPEKTKVLDGKERVLHGNLLLSFGGPPSAAVASPQPVRPKQPLQFKSPTEASCRNRKIIIEEDIDDEPYTELVPISASKPLNPEAADFRSPHFDMSAAVENPEADADGMENPMQTAPSRCTLTLL